MKNGPLIVVEDDQDDRELLRRILEDIGFLNVVKWFENARDALAYLKQTIEQPFLILSDINLQSKGETGLELKRNIDKDPELRRKSIPFVFYSTAADQQQVNEAYCNLSVQGFFVKQSDVLTMKNDVKLILDYWKRCKHPNSVSNN